MTIQRLDSVQSVQEFARHYGLRPDWHEPDEQDLTARTFGQSFDNAGFWGLERDVPDSYKEIYVVLYHMGRPVAEANIATLFAMACGTLPEASNSPSK